jgi:hypothetical protein
MKKEMEAREWKRERTKEIENLAKTMKVDSRGWRGEWLEIYSQSYEVVGGVTEM